MCELVSLASPVPGHLNPMTALARKLQSRGHDVVFTLPPVRSCAFCRSCGTTICTLLGGGISSWLARQVRAPPQ